jgi:hypothetical protein
MRAPMNVIKTPDNNSSQRVKLSGVSSLTADVAATDKMTIDIVWVTAETKPSSTASFVFPRVAIKYAEITPLP